MSSLRERLHIHDATPAGEVLLENNYRLQAAMDRYVTSSVPHLTLISEATLIGGGSYARIFNFNDELALKISGPATIKAALRAEYGDNPEDLRKQFSFLSALRDHLLGKRDGITTPEQFFVSHTPSNNLILGQELMLGWVALGQRMNEVYGPTPETTEVSAHINEWTKGLRARIRQSLGDFALRYELTDFVKENGRLHTGNVLVPVGTPLDGDMPLCIIDQPGEVIV